MTYINWDKPFYFEPSTLLPVEPLPGTGEPGSTVGLVPVPTYGNYGGAFYSQGDFLESPFDRITQDERPLDALDRLFLRHDRASARAAGDPALQAAADVMLVTGILNLNDRKLADPEASLYAALTTFALLVRLDAADYPVSPLLLFAAAADAYQNFIEGLAGVLAQPEERDDALEWLADVGDAFPVAGLGTLWDLAADHHAVAGLDAAEESSAPDHLSALLSGGGWSPVAAHIPPHAVSDWFV